MSVVVDGSGWIGEMVRVVVVGLGLVVRLVVVMGWVIVTVVGVVVVGEVT